MLITIPKGGAAVRDEAVELLEDFLYATAHLPAEEAAKIAGVSAATLSRWRRSGSRRLRGSIRNKLRRFLKERTRTASHRAA